MRLWHQCMNQPDNESFRACVLAFARALAPDQQDGRTPGLICCGSRASVGGERGLPDA